MITFSPTRKSCKTIISIKFDLKNTTLLFPAELGDTVEGRAQSQRMPMPVLDLCRLARVYLAVTHHLGGFTYTMAAEMLRPMTKRQQPKAHSSSATEHFLPFISPRTENKSKQITEQGTGSSSRVVIQSLSRLKITS